MASPARLFYDFEKAIGLSGTFHYRFLALFGVSPNVFASLWNAFAHRKPLQPGASPRHLLWALLFLKNYATETVNKTVSGADEKTFRKWCWLFVDLLSEMNLIDWDERIDHLFPFKFSISVDGTDFRIQKPYPFDAKWYSHKFKGPGLRYEVSISTSTGKIVLAHGPFPCSAFSDLRIFKISMKKALEGDEVVVADGEYSDEKFVKYGETEALTRTFVVIRARHETVNRRFKQFSVLSQRIATRHVSMQSAILHR